MTNEFEDEFDLSPDGSLVIKNPDSILAGEYIIYLQAMNKAQVLSDSFPIYITKAANNPLFELNFRPEIKNAPKKIIMERIRIEELKIEMFIADVNSDDGIEVFEATLDGKFLTEGSLIKVKTESSGRKNLVVTIDPDAELEKIGTSLEISVVDIPPNKDDGTPAYTALQSKQVEI